MIRECFLCSICFSFLSFLGYRSEEKGRLGGVTLADNFQIIDIRRG